MLIVTLNVSLSRKLTGTSSDYSIKQFVTLLYMAENSHKEYWWVQMKTSIRRSAFVALSKFRLFVALKRYIVPSLATTINVYNKHI